MQQLREKNINGKQVANYRYNVYANFNRGEFKYLDVIWCIACNKDKAEEIVLQKAKEMYEPEYNVSVMLTN